jgi:ABC-type branched-subunit amino acid transport system substrate-binding protein
LTARRALFAVLLLLPALAAASAPPDRRQLERGRRIYQEGVSPSGSPIVAVMGEGDVEVAAASLPCAGCHGRDGKGRPEGGVRPSDLTWSALSKPYGVTHPGGRRHPPYDARLLKRAISLGLDPAGNPLDATMPRFRMSLQDMEDLVAYLQELGTGSDPGVSDTAVRVGVLLPPSGPLSGMGKAVRAAVTARLEALNRDGGLYGRKLEARFFEAPGPADQRRSWTADFLDREEIFAGLAGFFAGADAELASLFEEKRVPMVGPFTVHPQETVPLNRYVFYLLPGIEAQEKALARFAARSGWPEPRRAGPGAGPVDLKGMAAAKAEPVLFPGSGPEALAFLQAADRLGWHPRFLATGAAADGSLLAAPTAFEGKIYLALPTSPAGPDARAAEEYRALGPLPADNLSAQEAALAAADVLIETLRRAGRDLSRETLMDQLESLRGFDTGFVPSLTYGPGRRLGARGAYVARLDLREKRLVPQGGWIEVE